MDVPPELVVELQAAGERSERKQAAARMAAGRMLSKQEVQRRLTKKGAAEGEAAETADWLEGLGAVNDEAYAGVIARHYGAMGYGPARVKQELHRRGIPRNCGTGRWPSCPPPGTPYGRWFAPSCGQSTVTMTRPADWRPISSAGAFPGTTSAPSSTSWGRT